MTTLRNEILPVKELTKRFVTNSFKSIQLSTESKNMRKRMLRKTSNCRS